MMACSERPGKYRREIALVKNIDNIGFYWGSYQARKPEPAARFLCHAAALV